MMPRIFGRIADVPPGSTWNTRLEVAAAGVHKPTMDGISGTDREGADSVVVSGGYEDDEDHGTEIIYTGTGGYNSASGKTNS
jgi:putative restriction endonuclease